MTFKFWDPHVNTQVVTIGDENYLIFLDHFDCKKHVYTACFKVTETENYIVTGYSSDRVFIALEVVNGEKSYRLYTH